MEDGVAAGEHAVSQDGAELAPSGVNAMIAGRDSDRATVMPEVREDRARAEVHVGAED